MREKIVMYQLALQLDHQLPFSNLSKKFPHIIIYRWCNREVDVLEAESPRGGQIDKFENGLKEGVKELFAELIHLRRYSSNALEAVIKCKCAANNSSLAIIEASKCIPIMPVIYGAGFEHVKLFAFTAEDQKAVLSNLGAVSKVTIEEKGQLKRHSARSAMTVSIEDFFGSLTTKQLHALVSAIEMGYYAMPKKATAVQIASKLKMPRSTLEEHLRKAEVKIMKSIRPYARIAYITSMNP